MVNISIDNVWYPSWFKRKQLNDCENPALLVANKETDPNQTIIKKLINLKAEIDDVPFQLPANGRIKNISACISTISEQFEIERIEIELLMTEQEAEQPFIEREKCAILRTRTIADVTEPEKEQNCVCNSKNMKWNYICVKERENSKLNKQSGSRRRAITSND